MMKNSIKYKVLSIKTTKVFLVLYILFFVFSCKNKPKEVIADNEFYVCSMDPQVMEKEAGMCPICKMPLAKTVIDKTQQNIIKLNKEQIKLANITTDSVKTDSIKTEKTLTGVFALNQNEQQQISARYSGRIEKLYYKIAGQEIKWGDLMYEVYSRDLMLAQQEYLFAIEKGKVLTGGGNNLIESAKNKLLLWGFTEYQIEVLEKEKEPKIIVEIRSKVSGVITEIPVKEGDYITEGSTIFKLVDLNTLWVEAQVYSNEMDFISEGQKVEVVPEAFPDETIEGEIDYSLPEMQPETKINLVRIKVQNKRKKLVAGMKADVIIKTNAKPAVTLPTDAVIQSGKNSHVWVRNKDGAFEAREVMLGKQTKDKIEIVEGLMAGEVVVITGAYLLYSDYVFKNGKYPLTNDTSETKNKNAMNGMKM